VKKREKVCRLRQIQAERDAKEQQQTKDAETTVPATAQKRRR